MSSNTLTIADLKKRLANDQHIAEQRERCKLYVDMFYLRRAWSQNEYLQLPGGGCADFTPERKRIR